MWHVCFLKQVTHVFWEHTMEKKTFRLDEYLMWLQNQGMMLFKCMVQLDTSVHFCCFVSFRLSYWCFDIMISEGPDLQVACFRPRWTWKGYVFVLFYVYLPQWLLVHLAIKHTNHQTNLDMFFVCCFLLDCTLGFITITPPVGRICLEHFPIILTTIFDFTFQFFSPTCAPRTIRKKKSIELLRQGQILLIMMAPSPSFCLVRYEPFIIHLLQFPRTLGRNQSMI